MLHTQVTRDQFEVTSNEVKHKPTYASFISYLGLSKVIGAAVGYNFRRLIRWLTPLFFLVLLATTPPPKSAAT
jgi:hypothetical protein